MISFILKVKSILSIWFGSFIFSREHYTLSWRSPKKIYINKTTNIFKTENIRIIQSEICDADVEKFYREAEYDFYYPDYYRLNKLLRLKKVREHYITAKILDINSKDTYLDVASQFSPAPHVYEKVFKCHTLRQDLEYTTGFNGRVIGSKASSLPLDSRSITKMGLHCSLEHFEGDEDIEFIREAERVLTDGGKLVITPLYLSDQYFILTQPSIWIHHSRMNWPIFPKDAYLIFTHNSGNRFERYYNAVQFINRILKNTKMETIIHSFGSSETCLTGQMRFVAEFNKSF